MATARDEILRQLVGLRSDIAELSKKKPDDAVNKFKLEVINNLITEANAILLDRRPLKNFEGFDDASLPTNSDVMVVLTQYVRAL